MKTQAAVPKHRVVTEMDDALLKALRRVAKAMHATTMSAAIRTLIAEADRKGKK